MPRLPRLASLAVVVLVAGCAQKPEAIREQATHAALTTYPGNPQRSDDVQLAAVDHRKDKQIELFNLTDRTIASATVWVNQSFLYKAQTIPPRGAIKVSYSNLLEQGRGIQDLDQANAPVKTIELQTPTGLYTVLGPARK